MPWNFCSNKIILDSILFQINPNLLTIRHTQIALFTLLFPLVSHRHSSRCSTQLLPGRRGWVSTELPSSTCRPSWALSAVTGAPPLPSRATPTGPPRLLIRRTLHFNTCHYICVYYIGHSCHLESISFATQFDSKRCINTAYGTYSR